MTKHPPEPETVYGFISHQAQERPAAVAITAPGRKPLTYRELHDLTREIAARFTEFGIGAGDRVAIVLPNGPEMATAFLTVASVATSAPLNPAYGENDFEFYLTDLNVKALLMPHGLDSTARSVAARLDVPVIDVEILPKKPAGVFRLIGNKKNVATSTEGRFAGPDDIALVLHTSGTTSRPKIVPLSHRNICTSARNISKALQLSAEDRCLNVMPLFHIHGLIGAVLSSIFSGASTICTSGFRSVAFFGWMDDFRPTWYTAVPTMHQAVLGQAGDQRDTVSRARLRFIRSSSAPLPLKVMGELESLFGAPVIESYGMTEASHQMASNPLPPGERKPGSVGLAAGPEVAVMDKSSRLLTSGETGEIVIRGANVTSGYENNPEANAEALTEGWFRTGDEGYLDEANYLYITGRIKEMINRGGEKIAPREIDEIFLEHPAVAQAVTLAVPHATLGEDVATAVVSRGGEDAIEAQLREYAFSRLADFKVPSQVIVVDEIPTGPTGKLQRIGLHEKLKHKLRADYVAPTNELEEKVCAIWREVLGQERIGTDDNFFLSGGDSLLASQVLSRMHAAFDVELPPTTIFRRPTVSDLAAVVEKTRPREVKDLSEKNPLSTIRRRVPHEPTALSFSQEGIWFLDQWEPGNPAYNRPVLLQLTGPLNESALAQAVNDLLRRHEALRTVFADADGRPMQQVEPYQPIELARVDLGALAPEEKEHEATRLALREARRGFDLAKGPIVRATLFRLGPQSHRLQLVVHHIAFDAWSAGVLLDEIAQAYEAHDSGEVSNLSELPIQYRDFSHWQRRYLQGETLESHLAFWQAKLLGAPPALELPFDHPRPPIQTFRGSSLGLTLSKQDLETLKALAQQGNATLFMVLLTAFNVLLCRYSSQDDIVVGIPVAGRSRVETEKMIGLFINTLALRTDLSGSPTFLEALARVREVALEAYAHQDLPFERLVEAVRPARDTSRPPIFQVMFNLENVPKRKHDFPGLRTEEIELDYQVAHLDLTLEMTENASGAHCSFVYNKDLFDAPTIERMAENFHVLLRGLAADPLRPVSRLSLLTPAERHQVMVAWNETSAAYPDRSIHELFYEQAARSPDAVAVIFEDQTLTYRELNRRSNRLAHYLRGLGVGPEVLVGLCLERSLEMVTGVLGILKAGGSYVPLDPNYPEERVAFMIEDAGASVLLTQQNLLGRLPENKARIVCLDSDWETIARQRDDDLPANSVECEPAHPAYIVYTSGSTGRPKGVIGLHRGAINFCHWMWENYPFEPREVCCQKTSLSFVDSVREIFVPLLRGIPLVIIPDAIVRDPRRLIEILAENQVTRIMLVPSLLDAMLGIEIDPEHWVPKMKLWVASGEALSPELTERFYARVPHCELLNIYGASEASGDTCYDARRRDPSSSTVPIGRPISNVAVYLLDRHLQPVPIGAPGEIHVGGVSLARGYLNQPELTAERFIPHPFADLPGERLYKTGDLARYRADGTLEYLGRIDNQVKIRGFRVELGEIEHVLHQSTAVREAAVVAREDEQGIQKLVAYVVPAAETPTISTLRNHLQRHLPEYMVPPAFVFSRALPLTPNGKVDRTALPAPDTSRPAMEQSYVAPRSPAEKAMVEIWQEVLELGRVGVHDDFFALGGHSLKATMLANRIRGAFDIEMPVVSIFQVPTIAGLVLLIEGAS